MALTLNLHLEREGMLMPRKRTHADYVEALEAWRQGDYEVLEQYVSSQTPILHRHTFCGHEWKAKPNDLQQGMNCPRCANLKRAVNLSQPVSIEQYREKFKAQAEGKYELLSNTYVDNKTKVKVRHLECGQAYWVRPNDFQQGYRCPHCYATISEGHRKIGALLSELGIDYREEKTFKSLSERTVGTPRFDYWIPSLKVLIEYDGQQHFAPSFTGEDRGKTREQKFKEIQRLDMLKNQWADEHDVLLYRIPYTEEKRVGAILRQIVMERSTTIESVEVYGGLLGE